MGRRRCFGAHDQTALVAVTFDEENGRVRLVTHRVFRPSPEQPLDFEGTIIATLLDWKWRFDLRCVHFDPWQLESVSQRLSKDHNLPMIRYDQTVPALTEVASTLFELIRTRNLALYADAAMRQSALQTIVSESSRGWRLAKEKQAHKIDVIVALGMAALGAVQGRGDNLSYEVTELFTGEPLGSANEYGLPGYDVGFSDPENPGQFLPEVAKRKGEREGNKRV